MTKVEVIDFYANWCGPCKVLTPTIDSLISEFSDNELVTIKKLNVDEDPETTEKYNVRGIPTLVFLKDGEEAARFSGVQSKDKITSKIQELQGG
jgi:thioredoxin 1